MPGRQSEKPNHEVTAVSSKRRIFFKSANHYRVKGILGHLIWHAVPPVATNVTNAIGEVIFTHYKLIKLLAQSAKSLPSFSRAVYAICSLLPSTVIVFRAQLHLLISYGMFPSLSKSLTSVKFLHPATIPGRLKRMVTNELKYDCQYETVVISEPSDFLHHMKKL